MKSAFQDFIQDADNRRTYEQEKLIVDTTEMIASVMQAKGITRAELAKRIGKSRPFVTQLLSGDQNITLRTLADVLWALESHASIEAMALEDYSAALQSGDAWTFGPTGTDIQASCEPVRETPQRRGKVLMFPEVAA